MAWSPAQTQYLADLLTGIGTGMLSAPRGAPPLAGFSAGIGNANALMGQRRQQADQDQERQWRQQQIARQQKMDAEADAAKKRQASGLSRLLGQPDPNATPKFVGGAGSGPSSFQQPAAAGPAPAWLTPDVASILSGMEPSDAFGVAAKLATEKPDAPKTQTFYEGGQQYEGYLKPDGSIQRVTQNAPRWQAPQPRAPSEMKQRAIDAGLTPGTPEYRNFMLTGGATPKQPNIITLHGPGGEIKSAYENDPAIPGMLQSNWTMEAPAAKAPAIVTLYDGKGGMKSFYDNDPQVKASISAGWTDKAPAEVKTPGIISLTKGDQTISINENDPQRGMYLGAGWVEAGAAQKPEKPNDLQVRAREAGLHTGTPEYEQFMLSGGKVPEGPGGAYGGTGIDQQDSNIILRGQTDETYRASPEYALAWTRQYLQPKIVTTQDPTDPARTISQMIMVPPPVGFKAPAGPMPAVPPAGAPAASPSGPQSAASAPQASPQMPAQAPAANPAAPTAVPIPGTGAPMKLNNEQSLAKGFADRMQSAETTISQPSATAAATSLKQGMLSALPGGNFMTSAARQQLEQAQRNFINAQLRRESGAAISESEFANARQQYFPQPGDSKAVLEQKAANRRLVIRAMQQSASPVPLGAPANASDLYDKFGLTPAPATPQ